MGGEISTRTVNGDVSVDSESLREDVKALYDKYEGVLWWTDTLCPGLTSSCGLIFPIEGDPEDRRFYVYEWFTKDKHKIFYVGKGTGHRSNHITSEIKRQTMRGVIYKELQENFGIDYRIVADRLTSLEAQIYELCWINERTRQGEVLVQYVDIPIDIKAHKEMEEAYRTRKFIPHIEISNYRKRYFGIKELDSYDPVQIDKLLFTHFLSSGWMVDPYTNEEKEKIGRFVVDHGGRVYSSLAKNAKSVVEFGNIDYDKYKALKNKGLAIFHSFHVLKVLEREREVEVNV